MQAIDWTYVVSTFMKLAYTCVYHMHCRSTACMVTLSNRFSKATACMLIPQVALVTPNLSAISQKLAD